jgi:carboxypeptidase T
MRRPALAFAAACAALILAPARAAADFPAADAGFHNDAETRAQIDATVAAHADVMSRTPIGTSYEGRELWAVKISDNVAVDEGRAGGPDHGRPARPRAPDGRDGALPDRRADLEVRDRPAREGHRRLARDLDRPERQPGRQRVRHRPRSYRSWRKNRQPNPGTAAVGTDLNRNWGFRWGCCGGSSGIIALETYRGTSEFSAPETQRLRDFILSRVVDGVQQIRASIDFHAFSELILWPFGHTRADVTKGMTRDDHDTFESLATSMARTNGYTAEQSSDLYITDGAIDDWLWGANGIFAFTFEIYPQGNHAPGFYPPDEAIGRETRRNREAVLLLVENAACPYAAIVKPCPTAPLTTIYAGSPGTVSPPVALTGSANFGLAFKFRRRAERVRVRVAGAVTRTVLRDRSAHGWRSAIVSLSRFAGQTVRISVDGGDLRGLRVLRY